MGFGQTPCFAKNAIPISKDQGIFSVCENEEYPRCPENSGEESVLQISV